MSKAAIVIGATGLVGQALLHQIIQLKTYTQIIVLTRRLIDVPDHVSVVVIENFSQLTKHIEALNLVGADAFCTLGTTIKQAGSRVAFRQVDYSYVHDFATASLAAGAQHFLLVSAQGSNASSLVFYSRVKGEIERDIAAMAFKRISIFRPSLLLGEREQSRLGEHIAERATNLFKAIIPNTVRPIEADHVATAMLHIAQQTGSGAHIYSNRSMHNLVGDHS